MSIEFYRVLHLIGIFMVLMALGGLGLNAMNGGTRAHASRGFIGMIHGIGLLLAAVAGFGMLAKLGLMGAMPGWAYTKMAIWLVLGALPAVFYKKPQVGKVLWYIVILLGATAAWLAIFKPF